MARGIKAYLIALAAFFAIDLAMHIAFALTGWDYPFGVFARGQVGGFIMGAVYWSRNPFPRAA